MTTPIPVGLIGLGRHGSRYLRHLIENETGGQLVAISRQQVKEGRRQAAQHRVQFFADYRDLIANPVIKAVLVVPTSIEYANRVRGDFSRESCSPRKTISVEFS